MNLLLLSYVNQETLTQKRMTITFKGTPIMIAGQFPKAGDNAPDFHLTQNDLSEFSLKDGKGNYLVLNIFQASTQEYAPPPYDGSTNWQPRYHVQWYYAFRRTCHLHNTASVPPKVLKTSSLSPTSATPHASAKNMEYLSLMAPCKDCSHEP